MFARDRCLCLLKINPVLQLFAFYEAVDMHPALWTVAVMVGEQSRFNSAFRSDWLWLEATAPHFPTYKAEVKMSLFSLLDQ